MRKAVALTSIDDNPRMRLKFTKMHGAGNDFIMLDATREPIALERAQWRWLADRRFGIGADQILVVGPPADAQQADFSYRIFNSDGGEVEQCGNGARAFVKFVRDKGLTDRSAIRVETLSGTIAPRVGDDGEVTVDMGRPVFDPARVPFDAAGCVAEREGDETLWQIGLPDGTSVSVAALSIGNPHSVQRVADVDAAPVARVGPQIEAHARFPNRVNAGFMQILSRGAIKLRVHERGAGETLACGTGACAAVVSGIRRGALDSPVIVHTRGGDLTIAWAGADAPVRMSGPAVTVFEGEIDVPEADGILASSP